MCMYMCVREWHFNKFLNKREVFSYRHITQAVDVYYSRVRVAEFTVVRWLDSALLRRGIQGLTALT